MNHLFFIARRTLGAVAFALFALLCSTTEVFAQGISGASVFGRISAVDQVAIPIGEVLLTEINTGAIRRSATNTRGSYLLESVPVGTYRIEARVLGFAPARRDSLILHLGDRTRVDLLVSKSPQMLETITATADALRDAGSAGPASIIPREAVHNIPLLNRDFVGLFRLSSQGVGPNALWISGQHARFNGIQIDGAIANDLFGINATPGSSSGARSISLEALDEIRVLIAPFDVRQGRFSGGLINAVTRSGTNERHASVFSSYSGASLVGTDTSGAATPSFQQLQFGATLSGPIIRDRLHYFFAAEAQTQSAQFFGPSASDPNVGVSDSTALRVQQAIRSHFGFDPGNASSPQLHKPNSNVFAKITWHPSATQQIDLATSFAQAQFDTLNRSSRTLMNTDGFQLSNSGTLQHSKNATVRLKATSVLGYLTNEFIATAGYTDDQVDSRSKTPLFIVGADLTGTYIGAGSVKSAASTRTTQRQFEFTENASLHIGSHLLTFGSQNALLRIRDTFFPGSRSVWTFDNVAALEANAPSRYEIALPAEGTSGPVALMSATMLSGYVQDRWQATPSLAMTAGIRTDIPFMNAPARNAKLDSSAIFGGINTSNFPSGNATHSPRVSATWDVNGNGRTLIRGGVGVFAGRPPMAWLSNAFSNTGLEQSTLTCFKADGVPVPTIDVQNLPSSCTIRKGKTTKPSVTFFDPGFRFQQTLKRALGIDHEFSHAFSASLDAVYTTTRNTVQVNDVNLVQTPTNSEGRAMYGSLDQFGQPTSARVDTMFLAVYRYRNVSGERSRSLSASIQRQWSGGGLLQFGYTWSRTEDIMSLAGATGMMTFRNNPLDGTIEQRNLRTSARDVPHSFVATAVIPITKRTLASLFLRARSGTPFAYTITGAGGAGGDANADGSAKNDLFYVPRDSADISMASSKEYSLLENFIESQRCLRQQRGHIMTRNSCRNPTSFSLDGRVVTKLFVRGNRHWEIVADFFNVPNMINRRWGLQRETSNREDMPLLNLTGMEAGATRPNYGIPRTTVDSPTLPIGSFVLPAVNHVVVENSRWRAQIGLRFDY